MADDMEIDSPRGTKRKAEEDSLAEVAPRRIKVRLG